MPVVKRLGDNFLTSMDSRVAVPERKVQKHAQPLLTLAYAHWLGSEANGKANGGYMRAALVEVAKPLQRTCPCTVSRCCTN